MGVIGAIVRLQRGGAMLDGVRMGLDAHGCMRREFACHGVAHPAAQRQQQDDEEQEPATHGGR